MLEFHPLANLFPLIEGREFDELVADVKAQGLLERIVMYEGMILDGRNRYRAALAAGLLEANTDWTYWQGKRQFVEFAYQSPFSAFSEATVAAGPLAYVLSINLHRRHLDESQRAMVAARIANLPPGRPALWNSANLQSLSRVKQPDAADMVSVSTRSVSSAKKVIDQGAPELVAAVDRGDVSVSAGAAAAELPVSEQIALLARKDPKAFAKVAKKQRAETQGGKAAAREAREVALGARQQALPDKRYGVILADPEWQFEPYSRKTGMDRAADNHYPTSPLDVIKARPVASIAADDCVLFLWATAPMLPQALEVMAAWGFLYKSHAVWRKAERSAAGGRHSAGLVLGTGYWFRNAHEILLVGTRGTVPAPAMGTQSPSLFDSPPLRHSQKPEEAYRLIEAYFPTLPRIELNARGVREGWDAWGNEAPSGVAVGEGSQGRSRFAEGPKAPLTALTDRKDCQEAESGGVPLTALPSEDTEIAFPPPGRAPQLDGDAEGDPKRSALGPERGEDPNAREGDASRLPSLAEIRAALDDTHASAPNEGTEAGEDSDDSRASPADDFNDDASGLVVDDRGFSPADIMRTVAGVP